MKKTLLKNFICLTVLCASLCVLTACNVENGNSSANHKQEVSNLCFYLKEDDTYEVAVGNAKQAETIVIPEKYQGKAVTSICEEGFSGCTSLVSVTIPEGVTNIGENAFYGCDNLNEIMLPSSLTSIENGAFSHTAYTRHACGNDIEVHYAGTIDEWVSKISGIRYLFGMGALYINNNLVTEARITTANKINQDAFYGYRELTSVTIGENVTSIGNYAFSACSSLTSINYNGTKEDWDKIEKGYGWDYYVPSSCVVRFTDGTEISINEA